MGITINDPYTENKITVSNSGTGDAIKTASTGSIWYSNIIATTKDGEKMVATLPIAYTEPLYCVMAKTRDIRQRDRLINILINENLFAYTWVEQDGLSFQDFKTLDAERFLRPCFIRDVKFSHSERTGKTSTVMFFEDGTKTVATPSDGETFDPETGIEQCILKRVFGNRSQLKKVFRKYIPDYKAKEKASRRMASAASSVSETKKAFDELAKSSEESKERLKKNLSSLWVKEEEGRPWD